MKHVGVDFQAGKKNLKTTYVVMEGGVVIEIGEINIRTEQYKLAATEIIFMLKSRFDGNILFEIP